jgi:hypothetical protein
MSSTVRLSTTTSRAPFQWAALVVGVHFLVIGVVGFAITGFGDLTEHDHSQTLMGFAINPLHNIVHLVVGVLGVVLWRTVSGARVFGWILALGYGAAAIYGLIVVDNPETNLLNINGADNVLHVVSALAGLMIAVWPLRREAIERADIIGHSIG